MAKSLLQKMKDLRKRGKDLGSYTTERKKRIDEGVKRRMRGAAGGKGNKKA